MKRAIWYLAFATFVAALFALALPANAQTPGVGCNLSATATVAAAGTSTLVGAIGTGTGRYLICGWVISVISGTTPTAQLSTGATCAALGTPLSPVIAQTASDDSPVWRGILPVQPGNLICLTAGGTTPNVSVTVYYSIG